MGLIGAMCFLIHCMEINRASVLWCFSQKYAIMKKYKGHSKEKELISALQKSTEDSIITLDKSCDNWATGVLGCNLDPQKTLRE